MNPSALRVIVVVLVAGALGACTLSYHTAPRYRHYPPAAAEVEARADQVCRERGEPAGTPAVRFATDGCSVWPDGVWQECCVEHDIDYWCGGTREQRRAADRRLRACVAERYAGWLALLMRAGVHFGGHPWIPAYFRWGYGHPYPSGYTEE